MPVRRSADPVNVQYVWDSIKLLNQQKQVADLPRIVKSIQRFSNCSQTQAELYVKQTLQDELINEVKRVQKGNNLGTEVESYKIANVTKQDNLQTAVDDGHDWYCIECHLAGDVSCCKNCYRVFHAECSTNARQKQTLFPKQNSITTNSSANESDDSVENGAEKEEIKSESDKAENGVVSNNGDHIYDETLCSLCNLAESDLGSGLDVEEFNYLLNFIHLRIKSWVPESLTSTLSLQPKYEWYTPAELLWRSGQLFYQHMDMSMVELKIRTKEYKKFSQFQADVVTMLHNVAIFHGVESQEYGAAELMIRDMKYDISELQNCVDCYKHSNEKINNKWFCLPCRVPHKLVWAKQKGYPYWPAKVIRETDTSCDVRFFSGKYERSILPKNCIKPITTSIASLHIKKTSSFNRAVEELNLHQKLLENPSELAKILSMVQKRKKPATPKTKKAPNVQNSTQKKIKHNVDSDDIYEFHDSPDFDKNGEDVNNKRKSFHTETPVPKAKKKMISTPKNTKSVKEIKDPNDVNVSDFDDDRAAFQFMTDNCEFSDGGSEQVTSSTELVREDAYSSRETSDSVMQKLEQPYSDAVERMRRKLESCKDKKQLIMIAMDCMQIETDRITNEHNDTLKKLFESHNNQISETKKKQWCFNCEQDAIYHCCWNTAYCSPTCQQQHWQAEHKKVCRRKR